MPLIPNARYLSAFITVATAKVPQQIKRGCAVQTRYTRFAIKPEEAPVLRPILSRLFTLQLLLITRARARASRRRSHRNRTLVVVILSLLLVIFFPFRPLRPRVPSVRPTVLVVLLLRHRIIPPREIILMASQLSSSIMLSGL